MYLTMTIICTISNIIKNLVICNLENAFVAAERRENVACAG